LDFSEFKRKVGAESIGHLTAHLNKLAASRLRHHAKHAILANRRRVKKWLRWLRKEHPRNEPLPGSAYSLGDETRAGALSYILVWDYVQ